MGRTAQWEPIAPETTLPATAEQVPAQQQAGQGMQRRRRDGSCMRGASQA
ncbi:hypothetical protein [Megalodesulfovibrio gigas]|uniref:Uncharacterized protein n=1 Tax=Megalodesulfovibrio gigas (strain ATCC 19364 / DSM 1382 / NCIMB 9332 / VKM B-1759) TaxID=1121448 RepID=T2GAY7_MEGG1|nr:hypothetical protein [Megalodesulfovibrio gigas]AGW13745.1 hypothetical protein DGI_1968 [Megalodesulfovibrio gigas DSM 1382 = ATCC 19364]